MSGTHKIYVDSRARVNPASTSHNKFVWQAPRSISVPKCRAFIDSVHLPVAWGTFHSQNQHVYISEQADAWAVGTNNKTIPLRNLRRIREHSHRIDRALSVCDRPRVCHRSAGGSSGGQHHPWRLYCHTLWLWAGHVDYHTRSGRFGVFSEHS